MFQGIIADAIAGPRELSTLSPSNIFTLLSIYNKRFVEFYVEYGQKFELYVGDNHHTYCEMCLLMEAGDEEQVLLEQNYIYSSKSNFLYHSEIVTQKEINEIKSLISNGYLHIAPFPGSVRAINLYYKDGVQSDAYAREDLALSGVLLNIPNKVNLEEHNADRHFVSRTPQYSRYIEAIKKASMDAKSMRGMNEVHACLLVMDDILNYIHTRLRKASEGDEDSILWFSKLLGYLDLKGQVEKLSDRDKTIFLQWCSLNSVIGRMIKVNHLAKTERYELVWELSSGMDAKDMIGKLKGLNYLY